VWLWPESRPWYPGTQVKCEPWGPLSRHHRACAYPSPAASDFPLHEEYSVSPCRRMQQLSKNGSGEMKGNISHNDAGSGGETEDKQKIRDQLELRRRGSVRGVGREFLVHFHYRAC